MKGQSEIRVAHNRCRRTGGRDLWISTQPFKGRNPHIMIIWQCNIGRLRCRRQIAIFAVVKKGFLPESCQVCGTVQVEHIPILVCIVIDSVESMHRISVESDLRMHLHTCKTPCDSHHGLLLVLPHLGRSTTIDLLQGRNFVQHPPPMSQA